MRGICQKQTIKSHCFRKQWNESRPGISHDYFLIVLKKKFEVQLYMFHKIAKPKITSLIKGGKNPLFRVELIIAYMGLSREHHFLIQ